MCQVTVFQGGLDARTRIVHERLWLYQQHVLFPDAAGASQRRTLILGNTDGMAPRQLVHNPETDIVRRRFITDSGIAQTRDATHRLLLLGGRGFGSRRRLAALAFLFLLALL